MKKLLTIFILIISIIFISGCTSEEKTNSDTTNNLQSSGYLINPTTLLEGYSSSKYSTYATSKMNTINGPFDRNLFIGENYEGDIPDGKKRVRTIFNLGNIDTEMKVNIFESDSDLYFEQSCSGLEMDYAYLKIGWDESNFEQKLIGDCSSLITAENWERNNGFALLRFGYKNYFIIIETRGQDREICRTETMKLAEAILDELE